MFSDRCVLVVVVVVEELLQVCIQDLFTELLVVTVWPIASGRDCGRDIELTLAVLLGNGGLVFVYIKNTNYCFYKEYQSNL